MGLLPITFRKVLAEFLRVEFKHDNPSYQQVSFLLNIKCLDGGIGRHYNNYCMIYHSL